MIMIPKQLIQKINSICFKVILLKIIKIIKIYHYCNYKIINKNFKYKKKKKNYLIVMNF